MHLWKSICITDKIFREVSVSQTRSLAQLTMSKTAGVLKEAGAAYSLRVPGFTPSIFGGVRVDNLFVFLSYVCFVLLLSLLLKIS